MTVRTHVPIFLTALILLITSVVFTSGRHVGRLRLLPTDYSHQSQPALTGAGRDSIEEQPQFFQEKKLGKPLTLEVAGSSLPDCSHACGSCSPCHLVMVSFVCATLEEAETCPMAYKCMCNRKSYPVP